MNTKAVNGRMSYTTDDVPSNFLWETDTKVCSFTFYYVQRNKIDADVPSVQRNGKLMRQIPYSSWKVVQSLIEIDQNWFHLPTNYRRDTVEVP